MKKGLAVITLAVAISATLVACGDDASKSANVTVSSATANKSTAQGTTKKGETTKAVAKTDTTKVAEVTTKAEETTKVEETKTEETKAEETKAVETTKAETTKAETTKAETTKAETSSAVIIIVQEYSNDELATMAKKYYYSNNGSDPSGVDVEEIDDKNVKLILWDYNEKRKDLDFYIINRETGKGTDSKGNAVDLTPFE